MARSALPALVLAGLLLAGCTAPTPAGSQPPAQVTDDGSLRAALNASAEENAALRLALANASAERDALRLQLNDTLVRNQHLVEQNAALVDEGKALQRQLDNVIDANQGLAALLNATQAELANCTQQRNGTG